MKCLIFSRSFNKGLSKKLYDLSLNLSHHSLKQLITPTHAIVQVKNELLVGGVFEEEVVGFALIQVFPETVKQTGWAFVYFSFSAFSHFSLENGFQHLSSW